MDCSILLYSSTACAVDKIVIRGGRTCCFGEENEDVEEKWKSPFERSEMESVQAFA
jgi:hypothetical protein